MITLLSKWRVCSREWEIDDLYDTEQAALNGVAAAVAGEAPGVNDTVDIIIQKIELERAHVASWNGSAWVMVAA